MVVGSIRRTRALLGTRLLLLTAGAVVMALPFAWMLSASFKPDTLVLHLPPQFVPHH
jgi:ABC-type glycerol-3-phosphate transport system permease component